MSINNNYKKAAHTCANMAGATLCAAILLATGANTVQADVMPLPIKTSVAKNISSLSYKKAISPKYATRSIDLPDDVTINEGAGEPYGKWDDSIADYNPDTQVLTLKGGTLTDPQPIFRKFGYNKVKEVNITGKLVLKGNANYLFAGLANCSAINGLANVDTSAVTSMDSMFSAVYVVPNSDSGISSSYYNGSFTTLDIGNWNVSHVTTMKNMFYNSRITTVDVSKWQTGNVTDLSGMFSNCDSLQTLDVSKWDTSKVTDTSRLFDFCGSLAQIDVSHWQTGNVTDMSSMFDYCTSLSKIDVDNWDTSKAENMTSMFDFCSSITELNLSKWNTESIKAVPGTFFGHGYSFMFASCDNLQKLDISSFDTTMLKDSPRDLEGMLMYLPNLKELHVGAKTNLQNTNLNTSVNWVSVGTGTVAKPDGTEYYSSDELLKFWNNQDHTEIWVPGTKYNININYVDLDDDNKVIQTDSISGNSIHPIDYKASFDKIVASLKDKKYEYVASNDGLPWSNGKIQLPDNVNNNTTYTVGFKHATATIKPGEKNPVTNEVNDAQSRTIKQIIKYNGAPNSVADNVQTAEFNRDAKVDLITGKIQYLNWDSNSKTFKDVTSPTVIGYNANPAIVKGQTVTPDSKDIVTTVNYIRSNYGITINYLDADDNNKVVKTDNVEGNPEKAIAYKDQMTNILASLTGYTLNKDQTNLPLNTNGDIQLPADVLGNKTYNVVLNHATQEIKANEKNPVTGKIEDNLTKTIKRTVKYNGANKDIPDNVQTVKFTRDGKVDMVTGKVTPLDWNEKEQSFDAVTTPEVAGYVADTKLIKAQTVTPSDDDIIKEVKYVRGNYGITINYLDTDNDNKVVTTDNVTGNPEKIISYKDKMNDILASLTGYVIDKNKSNLPLDENGDIKLPNDVLGDKDYTIALKHDIKTIKASDKNPVTGKVEDSLAKEIKQTIKYNGANKDIPDNVQTIKFTRDGKVDMVTGKVTPLDWNEAEQTFKDVNSPEVIGYVADPKVVKGSTVKPDDNDIVKEVKYTRGNYDIIINYVDSDNDNKIVKTDQVSGNPENIISYQDKLKDNLTALKGYVIDKEKSNLPLDENNDIRLPDDVLSDKDYTVVLKHDVKTIKASDKNPVTDKVEDSLTKTIKQTIKYSGVNQDISDNVQTVKFTRDGKVDMVTGKVTPLEWNEIEQYFNDVVSPEVTGYVPDPKVVKGIAVKPDDEDIIKDVKYTRGNYEITINYLDVDNDNKVVTTDSVTGNPDKIIDYKDKMKDILGKLTGYVLDKDKSNLPLDKDGNIKLPDDVLGDKDYTVALKHDSNTIKASDKNPVTGKVEDSLTKEIKQTIKYSGANQDIPDNVQTVKFTRDGKVDMVTGKVTPLDWNEVEQSFKDVDSPEITGYVAKPTSVKGAAVKPDDNNIVKEVKYIRGNYNITINYVDSDNDNKIVKTDQVSGNPENIISYQDKLKDNLASLKGYLLDKKKSTLPLDENDNIKLPQSVLGNTEYQVALKHDIKTIKAGDKNPVTDKVEDSLTKEIKQTIKYSGANKDIPDNVQTVKFTRDGKVDMVTGKVTPLDWNEKEQNFNDVVSPEVIGYIANPKVIAGSAVKPDDEDNIKEVKYSRGNYGITINYLDIDNDNKVVTTDSVTGNPDKIIDYKDKMEDILAGLTGYVIDKEKSNLPLDKDGNIKLPDDVLGDKDYTVALKHDSKTIKADEKNPVTGKVEGSLTKAIKQIVKYSGANKDIPDNVQTIQFTRDGKVDLVTGKVTPLDWNEKELSFKDVDSPEVEGYIAEPKIVTGSTVKPDDNDITKEVKYNRGTYNITIDYLDSDNDNKIVKTDKVSGNPDKIIAYQDKFKDNLDSLKGYVIDKDKSNLPLDKDGNIKLPDDVLGDKDYQIVLKHDVKTIKSGDKNPVTDKVEDSLAKEIKQTIKYSGANKDIPDNVQTVKFTRDGKVDMVTGKVTLLDWNEISQTFDDIASPDIAGYVADPKVVKGTVVKVDSDNIVKEVKYTRGNYGITINYLDVDNDNKVVTTDNVTGNPDQVINYKDKMNDILSSLHGYVVDKDKSNLPLDSDGNIKLPNDVLGDKDYTIALKHDSKTIKADEKNPVTGKVEDSLTKEVKQTIKYSGANQDIPDNVQTVKFTRDGKVDLVTGKVTPLDWNEKEQTFKDIDSPTVQGYVPSSNTVKGITIKPDDSDITKEVNYSRGTYNITINYVDSDNSNKVVKTDKVSGNPEDVIPYQDKLKDSLNSLKGYVVDKDKSNLPLDKNNDIKLPDDVLTDKDYTVILKHEVKTIKASDKNPVTGKVEDSLTKTIKQTIKYSGANKDIPDNVQTVKFTRDGKVDMVTGKVTPLDWNEKEQSFNDIASPEIAGYVANPKTVKGTIVKPDDENLVTEVKYSRGAYGITINYLDIDNDNKVVTTDNVTGNPEKPISYKDKLDKIIGSLPGYVIDKDKSTLPLDKDGNIKLPDDVLGDKDYTVALKHDSKTIKSSDKNPVTGKVEDSLTKTIKQTIKYSGANKDIPDNVQTVKFTRDGKVDLVTGKVTPLDWNEKEQTFKDVDSPVIAGYVADSKTIKGSTVKPDDNDITKEVKYTRGNYDIIINYVDSDDSNKVIKTDKVSGNPDKAISYKDKMNDIISSLKGYVIDKDNTNLPLDKDGNIKLTDDVLGNKDYQVVLKHDVKTIKASDKNPVTNKIEDSLTKEVKQTIKYSGANKDIPDNVQTVKFTRDGKVDMVTGKVTPLDWNEEKQSFKEVTSPDIEGYIASSAIVKAKTVTPDDKDNIINVKYTRGKYAIAINYIDLDDNSKVLKADSVTGNSEQIISYQDKMKEIISSLKGYIVDKDHTNLPLNKDGDVQLPDDVLSNKTYIVALKHDTKLVKDGDKNPVTNQEITGLSKTIKQTIKYRGAPDNIPDNVQTAKFTRDGKVDLVAGKVTYLDWNKASQTFEDVKSPKIDGYDADIKNIEGATVTPSDSNITKTVTYTKKETPSYNITINYIDTDGTVIKSDKQTGKAGTTIQYQDQLHSIIKHIGNGNYEIDKDKSSLPLDKNNDIKLPDDLSDDCNYQVVLKHKVVTISNGDKNPLTNKEEHGLLKKVKQIIKYTGASQSIPDSVQTVTFTRKAQIDLVTGKVTYLDWDKGKLAFEDVISPAIANYEPNIKVVKGETVTPDSDNIKKEVTYHQINKEKPVEPDKPDKPNEPNKPNYQIVINYQDQDGKILKTDKQSGTANSTIPYKDKMQQIINSIVKNGYEVDWDKSDLPIDSDGNIKLPDITSDKTYKLVLQHKIITFKHGNKNPFTGKEDPALEHKVIQTIKFTGTKQNIPDNIQTLIFTRNAKVDMVTGKITYLDWNEKEQAFKDITSPNIKGYTPSVPLVKGENVNATSKNIEKVVAYHSNKIVQTGILSAKEKDGTILGILLAALASLLSYLGFVKKDDDKDN